MAKVKNSTNTKSKPGKSPGPKRTPTFKKFEHKFKDQVVDHLKEKSKSEKNDDDFIFNSAPVVKKTEKELKKKAKKKDKELLGKRSIFADRDEYDEDPEFFEQQNKKQKDYDDIFVGQDNSLFSSSLQKDLLSFFMSSKSSLKNVEKISQLSYSQGTQIMGAICDKGPGGKYLVLNLSRNKKAYISCSDASENLQDFNHYQLGEYVVASVVASQNENKKIQASIKVNVLNAGLNFADIIEDQVIVGEVVSVEDYGVKLEFGGDDNFQGFLKKQNLPENIKLTKNKTYLFSVQNKNNKTKVVYCNLCFEQEYNPENALSLKKFDDDFITSGQIDIQHLVKPGNLVNVSVVKVITNGLLVKFLNLFYGYIFEDHLNEPVESYAKNQKLQARIIAFDSDSKQIHLSTKQNIINLSQFNVEQQQFSMGQIYENGFNIAKKLYGGSFFVNVLNKQGENLFTAFLHKSHLESELDEELDTQQKKLKVKELNYLEHYAILTNKQSNLNKKIQSWNDVQVGQIYSGTISKIIKDSSSTRVLVKLGEHVTGMIDQYNLNDQGVSTLSKKIKEEHTIKVRVLSLDRQNKKCFLTVKPLLMNPDADILMDRESVQIGSNFHGTITNERESGFIVYFFNNVSGYLSFKDIEVEHGMSRNNFKLGQTIKTYVVYVSTKNKHMGLTLSPKGIKKQASVQITLDSQIQSLPSMGNPETMDMKLGQVLDLKVNKKESKNDDYLVLTCQAKKSVKFVVFKSHLSDYAQNNQKLFDSYKKNKDQQLKGRIIKITQDQNIIVTCKNSITESVNYPSSETQLKENQIYYGYISKVLSSGVGVKLNESVEGFVLKNFLDIEESDQVTDKFTMNQTLKVKLHKLDIENKKILMNASKKQTSKVSDDMFTNFVNEEFQMNKQQYQQKTEQYDRLKVGNYINGTVSLVKDYGVILTFEDISGLTGFIMNDNLLQQNKSVYTSKKSVLCRILDIDMNKEILDLQEVQPVNKQKQQKMVGENNYNLKKINKYPILQDKQQKFDGKILLSKEGYLVVSLDKYPKVLALVSNNHFSNPSGSPDELKIGTKIKKLIIKNAQHLQNQSSEQINNLNKKHYLMITEVSQTDEILTKDGVQITLQAGTRIKGIVSNKKGQLVFIKFTNKNIIGRIHKSQFDYDPVTNTSKFDSIQQLDEIEAKILKITKEKHNKQLDLTMLKEHLSLDNDNLYQNLVLSNTESQKFDKNQIFNAVVKSIQKDSINPIYLELSANHIGYLNAFKGTVPLTSYQHLNSIDKHFKVGQVIQVKIQKQVETALNNKFELSIASQDNSNQKHNIGDLVIVKITNKQEHGLRVQLDSNKFGQVEVTEICDEWVSNPLDQFPLNSYKLGRILKQTDYGLKLSFRESILNNKIWSAVSHQGSALQYKNVVGDIEKNGDLRSRIFKFGSEGLKVDMLVMGYIRKTMDKGCFIQIGLDCTARASLSDLSDQYVNTPQTTFYVNRLVLCRIISIKDDGKCNVSLRESIVKRGYHLTLDKLKEGMVVQGSVIDHLKDKKASIQINGCKYLGSLTINDAYPTDNENQNAKKQLPVGKKVVAKIIKLEIKPKLKIKLGSDSRFFDGESQVDYEDETEQYIRELWESVQELASKNVEKESDVKVTVQEKEVNQMEVEQEEEEEEDDKEEEEDEEDNVGDEDDSEDENFMANLTKQVEEEDEMDIEEDEEDEIMPSDDESESHIKKKMNQKQKDKARVKQELKLREQEEKLLDDDRKPETNDDFEKLILKTPNSSYIWINYIAFKLEKEGIEASRIITERALRVINFRNENERLNLWTSYLNLENTFGNENSLIKVFQRALEANNPKKIYFKLIEIYQREQKYEIIEELCKKMIKKHKNSSKAWLQYLSQMLEYKKHLESKNQKSDHIDLKGLLQRALQCLKKPKHVEVLSSYARMEFMKGDIEKGRTTFEAIVQNYPKRTDIWSIYLDQEIKAGVKDSIRNLFERCISLKLKAKKMKFFFKRYLEFEISVGNSDKIEYVKNRANEYVQSILNDDDMEVEDE